MAAQAGAEAMQDRCRGAGFERILDEVAGRRLDPLAAADQVVVQVAAGGASVAVTAGGEAATSPIEHPHDPQ